MRVKIGRWLVIVSSVFVHFSAMLAVAQSTQRIGGSWFATEGKIGLVLKKGDFHPYFMYGECEKPRRQVRLNLEIEPKLFGDAVAREEYIVVRWGNEKIFLNEAGRYTWSPFLMAG